ncbi:MAG: hypothetical protein HY438_01765 [DPANN group archaeon]|nr:hypothetical protein [DPANN group archaeon]
MDINELMEALHPNNILRRDRRVMLISDFKDRDDKILEDTLSGSKTREEIADTAKQIASRFNFSGEVRVENAGSAGSLFALAKVNHNLPWDELRFKFNPAQVQHNLQHILFLNAHGEAGWNAAFAYGPSETAPLYIGMIDCIRNCRFSLPTSAGKAVMDGLLNYTVKYGTLSEHVKPKSPQLIKSHLKLVEVRVMGALAYSPVLSAESKTYLATRFKASIKHITDEIGGETDATWVLTDLLPENLAIMPGDESTWQKHKPMIVAYDQGYSQQVLAEWHKSLGREPNSKFNEDAFWGRFEYNLGQLLAAVQMDENVSDQVKDEAIKFVEDIVVTGKINSIAEQFAGGGSAYARDVPSIKPTLSRAYVSLGMAHVLVNSLAGSGDNPVIGEVTNRVLDALDRDGMLYKIYPDINRLKKGLVP